MFQNEDDRGAGTEKGPSVVGIAPNRNRRIARNSSLGRVLLPLVAGKAVRRSGNSEASFSLVICRRDGCGFFRDGCILRQPAAASALLLPLARHLLSVSPSCTPHHL